MADPRLSGLSALVVDDSRVVITAMRKMLSDAGIPRIDSAANSAEAEELMRGARYDMLFLDWHMAGKSGVALMEQCREDRAYDGVAIVIVSGEAGKRFIDEALKGGATSYLVKPFKPEQLAEHLDKALRFLEQHGRFKPA
jgi:two-component system chemotaxis response regulator CheY